MSIGIFRGLVVLVSLITILTGSSASTQPLSGSFPVDSIVVLIESHRDVFVGMQRDVAIVVQECPAALGSMELTIAYDPATFSVIEVGEMSHRQHSSMNWDSLTYENSVDYAGEEPVGVVRISGRMNSSDGSDATDESVWPQVVATMQFMVGTDAHLECETYFLDFGWNDCDDNTFTLQDDSTVLTSRRVIDCYDSIIVSSREAPSYGGPPLSCADSSAEADHRGKVVFYNAAVNFACGGGRQADFRGDLNLNAIGYEIADVEVYAEYLLGNEDILRDQWACTFMSDVNKDGRPWKIDDFAYLVAVAVGDALPGGCGVEPPKYFESRCFAWPRKLDPLFPKPIPAPREVTDTVIFALDASSQTIDVISDDSVGVMLLTFEGCVGVKVAVKGMEVRHSYDGANTRVLLLSFAPSHEIGRALLVGDTKLVTEGTGKLVAASAATACGCPLATVIKRK